MISLMIVMLLCATGGMTTSEFESLEPDTFEDRLIQAKELLEKSPLIDGQNDLAMSLHDILNNRLKLFPFDEDLSKVQPWASDLYSQTDLPRLKKGMVSAEIWSAWVPCGTKKIDDVVDGLAQVDVIKRLIENYSDDLKLAKSTEDIMDAVKDGKIASLIAIDGGHIINSSLPFLRFYYENGVRIMALTHICDTAWAESCCAVRNGTTKVKGLTTFGQLVVGEMNRLGMMVDLSHSSEKTMQDVLDVTAAPAFISTGGAQGFCNYSGSIPDNILTKLKKNEGLMMLSFSAPIVSCSHNASIHDVIDHLNYIRNLTGIDHIGIGSNFNGYNTITEGLENVSKFPYLFAELMLDPNWTKEDLEKLAGKNFLRVFKMVESVKDVLSSEKPIESVLDD